VSVLVLGSESGVGTAATQLRAVLGAERAGDVGQLLLARALAWARDVAAAGRLSSVPGGGGSSAAIASAASRALDDHEGPLLIIWPHLGRWRNLHAQGAIDDLDSGCELSVGPIFAGGFYLLGLTRLVPELFELPDEAWRSPEALGLVLGAAHRAGLSAGLLRPERGILTPADVRAALADPSLDPELRAVLSEG
jgi:glycosyltransferase A (GT-A) superfamily protein (DUF2064 family)